MDNRNNFSLSTEDLLPQTQTRSTNHFQTGQFPKAEIAQIPSVGQSQSCGGADGQTEEMLKSLRGILNKLTPERFEGLVKQVDELNIDTEESLKAVIELVFKKAVSEQSYSMAYAKMCHHMKGLTVTSQSSNGCITFHRLLLRRCQMEFRNSQRDNELLKEKEAEIAAAQKEAECQQLKLQLEQAKHKACEHSLGTVRFIGELFKLKMVTEAIIHSCLVKLIKNEHGLSLECLCKLLSTVGKDLDTDAGRPKLDKYFGHIGHLLRERRTSTRMRCMLLDVLDLRKNDWVPRRREEGPKTIKQIQQEVKQVGERKQLQIKKGQNLMRGRGAGKSTDRDVIHRRLDQSSSCDCDGNRKQACHCGSSSALTPEENRCWRTQNARNTRQKEPVSFQDEDRLNRGDQPKYVSRITVEHKNAPNQANAQTETEDESSRALSETSYYLEFIVKEEQVQDWDEKEVFMELKRLLQEKMNNNEIEDWIQNNLNVKQRSSDELVRALMRSVCESVIVGCGVHEVDAYEMLQRVGLLKKCIRDDQKQLVALNVLQELVIRMEHPDSLLRMFFDVLLDEEVIQDEMFLSWESSADGKTLASVSSFFAWVRQAKSQLG